MAKYTTVGALDFGWPGVVVNASVYGDTVQLVAYGKAKAACACCADQLDMATIKMKLTAEQALELAALLVEAANGK